MHPISKHPALDLANKQGFVCARELALVGAAGGTLQQLLKTGSLVKVGRGVYAPAGRKPTELDDLGVIAIKYPRLVFCLLTAVQLPGLTTQSPHDVCVAVGQKARAPNIEYPPLHVVRMSDVDYGTKTVSVDGAVRIPVTDVAKSIADCFKSKNKIGLDVALEAQIIRQYRQIKL